MHSIKPYNPPSLDNQVLEDMRAPPDPADIYDELDSSDEEKGEAEAPTGAFPGTKGDYAGSTNYF